MTLPHDYPSYFPTLMILDKFTDHRGILWHLNQFSVTEWTRMYFLANDPQKPSRGWHGHRIEKKAFMAVSGIFEVSLVHEMHWAVPESEALIQNYRLTAEEPSILVVPGGFANRVTQIENDSKMLILSNFSLEKSRLDDIRFPLARWDK